MPKSHDVFPEDRGTSDGSKSAEPTEPETGVDDLPDPPEWLAHRQHMKELFISGDELPELEDRPRPEDPEPHSPEIEP